MGGGIGVGPPTPCCGVVAWGWGEVWDWTITSVSASDVQKGPVARFSGYLPLEGPLVGCDEMGSEVALVESL